MTVRWPRSRRSYRESPSCKSCPRPPFKTRNSTSAELTRFAKAIPAEDVQLYYQIALAGRRDLSLAPEPRAGFEMSLLRMLAFRPDTASAVGTDRSRAAAAQPTAGGGSRTAADNNVNAIGNGGCQREERRRRTGWRQRAGALPTRRAPPTRRTVPARSAASTPRRRTSRRETDQRRCGQLARGGRGGRAERHGAAIGFELRAGLVRKWSPGIETRSGGGGSAYAAHRGQTRAGPVEVFWPGPSRDIRHRSIGARHPRAQRAVAEQDRVVRAAAAFEADPAVKGLRERFGADVGLGFCKTRELALRSSA